MYKHHLDSIENINQLLKNPSKENLEIVYTSIRKFRNFENLLADWPSTFMKDSELNWLSNSKNISDL